MLTMNTLETEVEILRQANSTLQEQVNSLQKQIDWFRRQIFGKRSEKIIFDESQLFIEGFIPVKEADPQKQTVKGHERTKTNRKGQDAISLPANLPVEQIFIDLPEEQKVCQETGIPLVKIGEEKSSKLAHKPGSYYIKEIIRPKYAHPKKSEEGIKIADMPSSLLTRCQVDDSFLADILVKKYADHLPLNRISEILGREDIFISRQLLSQWVLKCGAALKPLHEEMSREVLKSGNIFIDETPVKMLDPGMGETKFTYMWVLCGGEESNPSCRVYNFRTNRQHHQAADILRGYQGVVHSDKYGAYEKLASTKQFIWCPCWVHIRRKFIEAEHGDKEFRDMVLHQMQQLFELEEDAWIKPPNERLRIRQEIEVPIIDGLTKIIKERLIDGTVLPKSNFREALGYYCSLIPYLKNYTLYPWARLDNNVAERAVRPIALGRKNWLFLGNDEGGEAAAVILSLVQTCRALHVNPRIYLEDVMGKLMDHNSQKLAELLPHNWMKNIP